MVARTAEIVLGEAKFTIHAFNIAELQRIAKIFRGEPADIPFDVLRTALQRAEPKVADPDLIEATTDEIKAAMTVILELAGLKQTDPNPPQAPVAGS